MLALEVLFIDDEPFFMRRYVEALEERGCIVHFCEGAEDAAPLLAEHSNINALVLDIMMPTPPEVSDDITNGGLETGLWLLGTLEKTVAERGLAVLILTNRNPRFVEERLRKSRIRRDRMEVRSKIETPAFYLPDAIAALVERARASESDSL